MFNEELIYLYENEPSLILPVDQTMELARELNEKVDLQSDGSILESDNVVHPIDIIVGISQLSIPIGDQNT
jgi:hypothetical protein